MLILSKCLDVYIFVRSQHPLIIVLLIGVYALVVGYVVIYHAERSERRAMLAAHLPTSADPTP